MSKMYRDAVLEAKKLQELAEQNAKNKIIEAIAPQIKRLVEQELLDDEEYGDAESDADVEAEMMDDEMSAPADDLVSDVPLDVAPESAAAAPTEFSFEKDGKQVKVSVTVEGQSSKDDVLSISNSMLNKLGGSSYKLQKNSLGFLVASLKEAKTKQKRARIIKEIKKIQKRLIVMSEAGDKTSQQKLQALNLLLKENSTMKRRSRRNSRLNERAWWLLEQDDNEGGDDELDLGGDEEAEGGDEEVDAEAIQAAVEDLVDLLPDLEVSDAEEGDEDEEEEDDEMELELEADEMAKEQDKDETMEVDEMYFFEADEEDEADEMKKDEMKKEMKEADEEDEEDEKDKDEMVEISEAMLRREIARLRGARRRPASRRRRVSESRRRRRRLAEDAVDAADNFGGGDAQDEVFEVDENTLINALADELGPDLANIGGLPTDGSGESSYGGGEVEGEVVAERRRRMRNRRRVQESRRHRAAAQKMAQRVRLAERKAAAAKKELKESNLFNAKLLYVNKLMQSYDLNKKQQRAIVEALDNAKTLREAKLLYTSLTESLKKRRSRNGKSLNEGALRAGSASKSTRSSGAARSGVELDRWAILAGIK